MNLDARKYALDWHGGVRTAAEGWLGTPWVRNTGKRGVGSDCVRFVEGVLRDAGAPVPNVSWPEYPVRGNAPAALELIGQGFAAAGLRQLDAGAEDLPGDVWVARRDDAVHVGVFVGAIDGEATLAHCLFRGVKFTNAAAVAGFVVGKWRLAQ